MKRKSLPEIKKSLKSFILEEDAKVIDKSMIKVASITSFLGFAVVSSMDDSNAGLFDRHSDHDNHTNALNVDEDLGLDLHRGINPLEDERNLISPKSVLTAHGNHFNHSNDSSFSFLGISAIDNLFGWNVGGIENSNVEVDYRTSEQTIRELDNENGEASRTTNVATPQNSDGANGLTVNSDFWENFDWSSLVGFYSSVEELETTLLDAGVPQEYVEDAKTVYENLNNN